MMPVFRLISFSYTFAIGSACLHFFFRPDAVIAAFSNAPEIDLVRFGAAMFLFTIILGAVQLIGRDK